MDTVHSWHSWFKFSWNFSFNSSKNLTRQSRLTDLNISAADVLFHSVDALWIVIISTYAVKLLSHIITALCNAYCLIFFFFYINTEVFRAPEQAMTNLWHLHQHAVSSFPQIRNAWAHLWQTKTEIREGNWISSNQHVLRKCQGVFSHCQVTLRGDLFPY